MLQNTFNLTPDKAIKWFESKQLKISWDWMDVYNQEHAKAFTVAKAMSYDILNDIKQATERALKDGLTKRQFRLSLENTLKSKGWWGRKNIINPQGLVETVQLGSPWRLDTIYRTNMQSSYMAGRWQAFQDNKEARPYLQYIAVLDSKTRPEHRKLHNKIFHIDDPIWLIIYPINDFNCRCRTRALTLKQALARGITRNFKIPEGFPAAGFNYNVGLSNTGINTKMWKSWYKVNSSIGINFANNQMKSYMQQMINAGLFTAFIDLALSEQIGNTMAFGYLNKSQYDMASNILKSINSGALNITDEIISSSKISLIDKQNLARYLNGKKDIEMIKKRLVIKVKSQTTDKVIKLVFRANNQDLILQSVGYLV